MCTLLQKELDVFKNTIWNNHRGRKQKNKELSDGIPEHIYHFPQHYGATKCGTPVSDEELEEVAQLSNVLENTNEYLPAEIREQCDRILPDVHEVLPNEASNAFLFLKQNFDA
jgi:hypothetical protein